MLQRSLGPPVPGSETLLSDVVLRHNEKEAFKVKHMIFLLEVRLILMDVFFVLEYTFEINTLP